MKTSVSTLRLNAQGHCAAIEGKVKLARHLIDVTDITVAKMLLKDIQRHAARALEKLESSQEKDRKP